MSKAITKSDFLKSPAKYLAYTGGSQQIIILDEDGEDWIILGSGSQRPVTLEEIEEHEKKIDSILEESDDAPCDRSWFD